MGQMPQQTPGALGGTPGMPGMAAPQANFTAETKFKDLPEQVRQKLAEVHKAIHDQQVLCDEVSQHSSSLISQVADDAGTIGEKLATLQGVLESDISAVQQFKRTVLEELRSAEFIARLLKMRGVMENAWQNFTPPSPYFQKLVGKFEDIMRQHSNTIDEFERYITAAEQRTYSPQMLQDILRNQHQFFLSAAAQVASLHEQINSFKEEFLSLRKTYQGDSKDVFAEAARKKVAAALPPPPKPMLAAPAPMQGMGMMGTQTPGTGMLGTPGGGMFGGQGTGLGGMQSAFPGMGTGAPSMFGGQSSLFSGQTTASPLMGQQQQPGAGILGQAPGQPAGGLFGQQPHSSPSLYGAAPSTPGFATPLHGATTLFGSPATPGAAGMFGSPAPGTPGFGAAPQRPASGKPKGKGK